MKKLFLMMGLAAISAIGFGQARENRVELEFDRSSQILSESTGWYFNNSTGEWIENQNFIDSKHYDSQGSLLSYMKQNFISIETKIIKHEGRNIYVLILQKWSGSYRYPTIREDWQAYKTYNLFFFEEEEYLQLSSIENNAFLKCKYQTSFRTDRDGSIEDTVQYILQNSYGKYNCDYVFSVLKSEEGQIRYYLPYQDSKYSLDTPCNYGDKFDFEKCYFETTPENFSKIYTFSPPKI